jgi:hypothetical protein
VRIPEQFGIPKNEDFWVGKLGEIPKGNKYVNQEMMEVTPGWKKY